MELRTGCSQGCPSCGELKRPEVIQACYGEGPFGISRFRFWNDGGLRLEEERTALLKTGAPRG